MRRFLFQNSHNLVYKYTYFNSQLFRQKFLIDFLYYIWIGMFFAISYQKESLNFSFLNYINLVESLFGYKPSLKQFYIDVYNNKKILRFMKKKNVFTINFKFFLYLEINSFALFNFLQYCFSLFELYRKFNYYLKLRTISFKVIPRYSKNNLLIYKFSNIHLFLNVFYHKYVENSCVIKSNILLYLYFIKFYFSKFDFLKKYV